MAWALRDLGRDGLVGAMSTKVQVTIRSDGDDWPEEVQTLKDQLLAAGYTNVAEGSADYRDALPDRPNPKKWWILFERKIE